MKLHVVDILIICAYLIVIVLIGLCLLYTSDAADEL